MTKLRACSYHRSAAILFAMPPPKIVDGLVAEGVDAVSDEGDSWPAYPQIASKSAIFPSVACVLVSPVIPIELAVVVEALFPKLSTTFLSGKNGKIGCT
jgi:hypothetical protein